MHPSPSADALADLPVAVSLPEPLAREVRAWVENELGWQVVPPAGPPRPALAFCSPDRAAAGAVVVTEGEVDTATLRRALEAGARDAIGWPADRDRLIAIAAQPDRSTGSDASPTWRIAGTGGGVGTSTVALALAGLAAWSGRAVVAVGDDDMVRLAGLGRWEGPGLREIVALGPQDGGAEVEALARPVPGVDGLRVLGGRRAVERVTTGGWSADLVVLDEGVVEPHGTPPDTLVTSPDARAKVAAAVDAPLVVVGDGPLDERRLRGVVDHRPVGWLPSSARVARAGLAGRVPADLPGSWLRILRDALAEAVRR